MLGFPGGSDGKQFACNMEDKGSVPRLGRSPGGGHGHSFQSSCLVTSIDRGAVRLQYMGLQRVMTEQLSTAQVRNLIELLLSSILEEYFWRY